MFKNCISVIIASVFLASSAFATELTVSKAFTTEITINGSTTVLPIVQKVSEAYMAENPTVNITISGGGSGNGIKALVDKLTHIAMSSRTIKDSEIGQAKINGVNPHATAVGLDALVPVVHPDNKVSDLTIEQLQGIYTGKITNWREVGGSNGKIVVISRDTSSGTYETWAEFIMRGERVMPAALLQASNGSVVQTVSTNKNAIGYIGFGYLNDTVKATTVGGIEANTENALSKSWPLSRELWFYTSNTPKGDVKKFIDYLLSDKGQELVKEVGYIPVK